MAKGCALSTGYLSRGGLPRNSVDMITDRPDMTSAVDRGRKASNKTKKTQTSINLNKIVTCKVFHRIALLFKMQHGLNICICFHLTALYIEQIIDIDSEILLFYEYRKIYTIVS